MSNSIDQRIVEMQFDNSQFEKGVASTLQSLKNLESGLNLKNGMDGLDKVQSAVNKISFKDAENETNSFAQSLGGLKDTALNVFDHITTGIGTLAKGYAIVKSIFSAGIGAMAIQGGWSRASNLNKAAFKLDSMGVGWKNVSESVSEAVDGTAYSLDAAATSAALFASSGVKAGDDMTRALKATANLASISGTSFEQIGDIMAKVAAQGKLTGRQIDSFMFAGIDVAGILKSELNLTQEGFEQLRKQGISLEQWVDVVMSKFGDAAALANNSFDGAMNNMRSALNRTFADLFQYGQQGMIPMFNAIRESINTTNAALKPLLGAKWKWFDPAAGKEVERQGVLIEGFVGIMEEASKAVEGFGGYWTDATGERQYNTKFFERTNRIVKMFAEGLMGPIGEIKAGTRDLVWGVLRLGASGREVFRLVSEFVAPIGMAFHDLFGDGSFAKATKAFNDAVHHNILDVLADLHVSTGVVNTIRSAFQVLFTLVKGVGTIAFKTIGSAIVSFVNIIASAGVFIGGLFDMFDTLRQGGAGIGEAFGAAMAPVVDFLREIPVVGNVIDLFSKIPEGIGKLIDSIKGGEGSFEALSEFLNGVDADFGAIGDNIAGFFQGISGGIGEFAANFKETAVEKAFWIMERINEVWARVSPGLIAMKDQIGEVFKNIASAFSQAFPDMSPFEKFGESISSAFGNFMSSGFSVDSVKTLVSSFVSSLGGLKDELVARVKEFFSGLGGAFSGELPLPLQAILAPFKLIGDAIHSAIEYIKEKLSGAGIDFSGIKNLFSNLTSAFSAEGLIGLGKLASKSGGIFKAFDFIKELGGKLSGLIGSFKGLSSIKDALAHPFETIGSLLAGLGNGLGSGIETFISKLDQGKIGKLVATLSALGISAGVIVGLQKIGKLFEAFGKIGNIGKSISGAFDKLGSCFDSLKTAIKVHTVLEVATAIGILVGSLIALATYPDKDKLWEVLPLLAIITGVMVGITVLFGKLAGMESFDFESVGTIANAMQTLVTSVILVSAAIALLGSIGDETLVKGGSVVAGIVALFALLTAAFSKMGKKGRKNITAFSSSMSDMANALLHIYVAVELFGRMDEGVMKQGMKAVTAFMLLMGVVTGLMSLISGFSKHSKDLTSVAAPLAAMAILMSTMKNVVEKLGAMKPDELDQGIKATAKLFVLVSALALIMTLLEMLSGLGKGGGGGMAASLLAVSVAIGVMALSVAGLGAAMSSGLDIGGAMMVLAGGLIALGLAMALIGHFAPQMTGTAVALMGLVIALAALTALAAAVAAFGDVILQGLGALTPVILVFIATVAILGAIGLSVGAGLVTLGMGLAAVAIAVAIFAGAALLGIAAMAGFAAIADAFIPAFERFTAALIECFKTEDFVGSMIGMSIAMALLGAACIILGLGLGVLSLAMFAFGEVFPGVVSKVTTAITQLATYFTSNREIIATGVKNMLVSAVEGIASFAAEMFNRAQDLGKSIGNGLRSFDIAGAVKGFVTTVGGGLRDGIGQLLPILLDIVKGLGEGLVQGIIDVVKQPINDFNAWLYDMSGGLMGVAPTYGEAGDLMGSSLSNSLDSTTQNLGQGMLQRLGVVNGQLAVEGETMKQTAGDMANGTVDAMEGATQGFDFIKALNISPETLAGGFDSVKAYLEGQGIELPDNVIQGIADGLNGFELTSLMQESGGFDINGLADKLGIDAQMLGPAFQGGTEQGFASVDITGIVTGSQTIDMDAIQAQFTEAGTAAGTALSTAITDSINVDGAGPIEKVASSIKAASSSIESAGRSLGKSADTGFKAGTKDMKTKGKSAGNEAINGLRSQSSSANSAGRSVGAALGNGLAAGIRAALPSVRAAANAIVAEANRAAKAKAEINSPSKVWMRIGHGLGEGLIMGMDQMHRSVGEAAGEMFDPAISAAMSQAGYLTGLLEDIDDQPTIRPVLDLTDYEAGITRMQGLNASAPMNSAQWANRLYGTGDAGGNLTNNNTPITINLNYEAGDDANAMVRDICRGLQVKSLMEA